MDDLPLPKLRALLARVALRDNAAITEIHRHYKGFVFAHIRRRLEDWSLAEEVLNDTFWVMYRKPDSYDYTSKFSTWLCGIADNKIRDAFRARRRNRAMDPLEDDAVLQIPDLSVDLVANLEYKEALAIVRECMDELSEDHRKTAYLVFCGGLTQDEVAEILGCPPGTVKSRLNAIRAQILRCVRRRYADRSDP